MPVAAVRVNVSPEQHIILVVEDEVLTRVAIAEELRGQGLAVREAANADEAIAILETDSPIDLVFTDMQMPGSMDGIALVHRLRQTHPHLKLVVTSAYSPAWPYPTLADAFIGKPYDAKRVVEQLKNLLQPGHHERADQVT